MPCWEWVGDGSVQRSISDKHAAASGTGESRAYGTLYRYNNVRPKKSETFNAHGFEWADLVPFIAAAQLPPEHAAATISLTDFMGFVWGGCISSLSWKRAEEGTNLWDATMTIDYPTLTP